jgi:hypothetical protein
LEGLAQVYQEFLDKFGKLPFSVKNTDKYIVYSPKSLGLVHAHLLYRVTPPASSMSCLMTRGPDTECWLRLAPSLCTRGAVLAGGSTSCSTVRLTLRVLVLECLSLAR